SVPGGFASIADLRAFARGSHERIIGCRDGVSDARLADAIEIPRWFGFKEPLTITVGEALTQMAMHSQWHRGQNATRLRESRRPAAHGRPNRLVLEGPAVGEAVRRAPRSTSAPMSRARSDCPGLLSELRSRQPPALGYCRSPENADRRQSPCGE